MDPSDDEMDEFSLRGEGHAIRVFGYAEDHIFSHMRRRGEFYELDLLRFVHELLADSPVGDIVDVGANLGNHSLYFAGIMGRRVVAIEPEPANLRVLSRNIEANGLSHLVEVHACAAWDRICSVQLIQTLPGNRGTFQAVEGADGGVQAIPLDSLLSGRDVALLKIDVEGAESRVLDGAVEVLGRCRPLVITESHGPRAVADIAARLHPLGYRRAAVLGLSDNYLWVTPSDEARTVQDAFVLENTRRFERLMAHNSDVHGRRLIAATELGEGLQADVASLAGALDSIRVNVESHRSESIGMASKMREDARTDLQRINAEVVGGIEQLASALTEHLHADVASLAGALDSIRLNVESHRSESIGMVSEMREDARTNLQRINAEVVSGIERLASELTERLNAIGPPPNVSGEVAEVVGRIVDERLLRVDELSKQLGEAKAAWTRLARAYQALSDRYARKHPEEWSREAAVRVVMGGVDPFGHDGQTVLPREPDGGPSQGAVSAGLSPYRSLPPLRRVGDRVRIGIASMPGREKALAVVLRSLASQADEIFVYLNGMDSVPPDVAAHGNVQFFTGPDLGDRGKFVFLEGFEGYYLTCDDDIEYPRYYVSSIIDGIERYGRKAVVGWHGSQFSNEFENFYEAKSRKVLSFRFLRGRDTPVHLLGTGVSGFHTDTIVPSLAEFVHPNMADAFLAIHAQRRSVPMIVLAHQGGEARPIETPGSISAASIGKDERGRNVFDVAATVTRLIKDQIPWRTFPLEPVFIRAKRRVAIVGRTDVARWRKGGILKSCHLTRDMLLSFGWDAHLADIETGDPFGLGGFTPDLVMVYVGDPERPDFSRVVDVVEFHARQERCVVVNLSDNGLASRHAAINQRMSEWASAFGDRVRLMTFTTDAARQGSLGEVESRGLALTIPKTLVFEESSVARFSGSSAVFVGDVAKLSDPELLGGDARSWIEAIRRAVPGAPIVGVRQYSPRYSVDLGLDEVWPFLNGREMVEKMQSVRVAVSVVKFATFEMVPVEVAGMGIPVFYRRMPQSLSAYLGQAGLEVDSPGELEARLGRVYRDPLIWRGYSQAGANRANSAEFQKAGAFMMSALESFIEEARSR